MTIGESINLRMVPFVPLFEEGRIYLCVFKRGDESQYFAAHLTSGQWHDALGNNLTDDGWELIAHTAELPLLGTS